jgi:hypothetical protein
VENRVCLSHGVQIAGATWWAVMRIIAEVGELVQRTGDVQAQVGYSVARQSGGRETPCVICTVHKEMRSASFLVEPQNQGLRFPSLDLKIGSSGLVIWASKLSRLQFVSCATKPIGGRFDVGHTLRSSGLLHLEASHDRVL